MTPPNRKKKQSSKVSWEFRAAITDLCRRVTNADLSVRKASDEMHGMSAGSGITPFINDHRRAVERLHKIQDELIEACKRRPQRRMR
jgi:50S ribosomal subunit-associated GTPase HflX